MIVGQNILEKNLVRPVKKNSLKNGTFDLTIGDILVVGEEGYNERRKSPDAVTRHLLKPQEMIWIISAEEFSMPNNVTGLATLRTTLTHQGLLALNVGIIDSNFEGKISTAIINFSNLTREIKLGDKFFRILFFKHDEIPDDYKFKDQKPNYDQVNSRAGSEFPKNFLNIPSFSDEYYGNQFKNLLWGFIKTNIMASIFSGMVILFLLYDARSSLKTLLDALAAFF